MSVLVAWVQQAGVVGIDGRDFEQVVHVLDGQVRVEVAITRFARGYCCADGWIDIGVVEEVDVGAGALDFDRAPASEKPVCI